MNQFSNQSLEACCECSTVVELLRLRSFIQPDRDAFTFLLDGETQQEALTYQQLDRLSRRIAVQLQARGLTGERALLLYPPGLDYFGNSKSRCSGLATIPISIVWKCPSIRRITV
ncbi:hypothetical protein NUACC21_21400 [Scytonema sp. NUACC21]